jgi:mannose-6-phosphate isomerase
VTIHKLSGVIQNYAWGSHSLLAQLQGRPFPTVAPEAELWFGAHPLAPSEVEINGSNRKLDSLVADDPGAQLGSDVARRFGRLPFLLKVLAVDQPLSIQVHPSSEQAKLGFLGERARNIAVNDSRANYRDDWAKPELLCPLTPFEALCDFRPIDEIIELLAALGGSCFGRAEATLRRQPDATGLRDVVATWMHATGDEKAALFASAINACSRAQAQTACGVADSARTLALACRYPGDMGVLVALLLRYYVLSPGVGLYVQPGVLHAYLRGFAIEVMASSDNVLRGGLTPKNIDVDELLALTSFDSDSFAPLQRQQRGPLEYVFDTDTPQFRTTIIDVEKHTTWCAHTRLGPEMLLCVAGRLSVTSPSIESLVLDPGECAWVPANEDVYCASGAGQGVRVQVGCP